MNILFLTMNNFSSVKDRGIYTDLLRCMAAHGHKVTVLLPREKKYGEKTHEETEDGVRVIKVETGNLFNVNIITKTISRYTIKMFYEKAIREYIKNEPVDLVLYSTPPTTVAPIVKRVKKKYGAFSYLLLKDIFPQNAVDIGMVKAGSPIHRLLRQFEKRLYKASDMIGCMSQANVDFIKKWNPYVQNIEVCPNTLDYIDSRLPEEEKRAVREKYELPADKKIFVYGGNLGRPQGVPFFIDCIRELADREDVFFLVIGSGTEFPLLERFAAEEQPKNFKLMQYLPTDEYRTVVSSCDYGMIFLDHRFTIPNYPSRILDYMQAGLPVLACTDPNSDIGKTAEEGEFGVRCESNDVRNFREAVEKILNMSFRPEAEAEYFKSHFDTECAYDKIMKAMADRSAEERKAEEPVAAV